MYRRFSSDEQERGDSLTRQTRECERYARTMGWTISATLTDKGRSAYAGDHLKPDAELGIFIARLDRGEISNGSILLVERLDRLSRRPVAEAMSWLYSLTTRGLQIAIADKGKVFTSEMSFEDFLTTALSLAVGNEESAKKSERTLSTKKRLWALAEKKEGPWTNLAARPPLWLKRLPDGWEVNEHRAQMIRDIYQWSANGLGAVLITNRLNRLGEHPWGLWRKYNDGGWGRTAVRQLLANPAVEGDFVGETGTFAGRVIHAFYPRIVDADLVASARLNQQARSKAAGKRASVGSSNLFPGVVCGECGHRAFLSSSVSKGKRYAYFRCEAAADGRPMGIVSHPLYPTVQDGGEHERPRCHNRDYYAYERFEAAAMDLCLDLALDDRFFRADGELRDLRVKVAELEKSIADKKKARSRLIEMFADGDDQLRDRIFATRTEIDELTDILASVTATLNQASGKATAVDHLRRVNDIRESAASVDPLVREQARAKLRTAFGAILNSVAIEHSGDGTKVFTVAFLGGILSVRFDTKGQLISGISDVLGQPIWHPANQQPAELQPLIRRIEALVSGS